MRLGVLPHSCPGGAAPTGRMVERSKAPSGPVPTWQYAQPRLSSKTMVRNAASVLAATQAWALLGFGPSAASPSGAGPVAAAVEAAGMGAPGTRRIVADA